MLIADNREGAERQEVNGSVRPAGMDGVRSQGRVSVVFFGLTRAPESNPEHFPGDCGYSHCPCCVFVTELARTRRDR